MRNRSKQQLNNKGFSLVELLIAIVILSIIVFPLLHSFVTATRTNTKAKRKLEATEVAQNAMERIKGTKLKDLGLTYDKNTKKYMMEFSPTETISNGNGYYVRAFFDAEAYKKQQEEDAQKYNDKMIPNISDMDVKQDGFYVQNGEQDRRYAQQIVDKFQNNAPDLSAVMEKMKRTITITIQSVGSGTDVYTEAYVLYNYSYRKNSSSTAKTYEVMYQTKVYDNSDINNGRLRAVYLFYNPLYTSTNSSDPKDSIRIVNNNDTQAQVYLIKQDGAEKPTDVDERNYKVGVSVYEKEKESGTGVNWITDSTYRAFTSIRTNIGWSVVNKNNTYAEIPEQPQIKYYHLSENTNQNMTKAKEVLSWNGLTAESAKERMYDVTVEVYKKVDNDKYDPDNLVLTYTGSKEE